MLFWEFIYTVFYALYIVLVIYTSGVIIYQKSDPVKSLSWIIVILSLPYIGLILYILFGQNFRKRKLFNRKGVRDERVKRITANRQLKQIKNDINFLPEHLHEFKKLITLNLKSSRSILGVNSAVEIFFTGKEALDSMYNTVAQAKQHIHLQSYIIEDDEIGNKFKNLLIKKANEGVEVRLLYDDIGCWSLGTSFKNELSNNGVELLCFSPVKFLMPTSKANYRNHRKILVTDGLIGYIGGVNIADRYYTGGNFSDWRDTHIQISGESVAALQSSFLLDRYFIINQQFNRKKKYYPIEVKENFDLSNSDEHIYSQIITSGPDSDWAGIMQCYFSAIASAKKDIFIVTPYFTPNESILNAIKTASLGGVDVCLMLSEKSDTNIAQWGTMSYATELLEAGVKVYLLKKGFNHSKVISIDSKFCIVGSANMDNRSLEHNFEITGIIYNSKLAKKVEQQFRKDIPECRNLASSKWAKRSFKNKLKESLARLLSPLI